MIGNLEPEEHVMEEPVKYPGDQIVVKVDDNQVSETDVEENHNEK